VRSASAVKANEAPGIAWLSWLVRGSAPAGQ